MIQRIQTVFLLIAAIVVLIPFFSPYAQLVMPDIAGYYSFYAYGVTANGGEHLTTTIHWALLLSYTGITLLPIIALLLYKKQRLQLRLCLVDVVLVLGSLALMWYYIQSSAHASEKVLATYTVCSIFPLISAVFVWLATRGIKKDIQLLKSYDRVR